LLACAFDRGPDSNLDSRHIAFGDYHVLARIQRAKTQA
jgi:hypothetical protein